MRQEIGITSGAMRLFRPQLKEQSAFQDKRLLIGGLAEARLVILDDLPGLVHIRQRATPSLRHCPNLFHYQPRIDG
jgi:hypothetical protein